MAQDVTATTSTISLPAQINHACAKTVVQSLYAAVAAQGSDGDIVVDASTLQKFDSSALAVLLSLWRLARQQNRGLQVQAANAHLHRLAALYEVDGLLLAQTVSTN